MERESFSYSAVFSLHYHFGLHQTPKPAAVCAVALARGAGGTPSLVSCVGLALGSWGGMSPRGASLSGRGVTQPCQGRSQFLQLPGRAVFALHIPDTDPPWPCSHLSCSAAQSDRATSPAVHPLCHAGASGANTARARAVPGRAGHCHAGGTSAACSTLWKRGCWALTPSRGPLGSPRSGMCDGGWLGLCSAFPALPGPAAAGNGSVLRG